MNVERVIWGLEELTDRDFQERVWWSAGSEGEMSSFAESVCRTFDDSGLGDLLDSGREHPKMLPEFREKAIKLDQLCAKIPSGLSELEIINHPVMQEIRDAARKMLAMLTA